MKRVIENEESVKKIVENKFNFKSFSPEAMNIHNQISLFSNAEIIVGQYSSALHNALFAAQDSLTICIGHNNLIQSSISSLTKSRIAYFSTETKENYEINLPELELFLSKVL